MFVERGELPRVLAFITGLDEWPLLGFDPPLTISFLHREDVANVHQRDLPFSNTCANTLSLPVGVSYEQFKETMNNAMEIGFIFVDE